jgi:nicotinamide phosphoribosyltransferase
MNYDNVILNTDSYKISHYKQYPPGTTNVFSYAESRGGIFPETVFFGLQAFLKSQLQNPVTMEDIDEAEKICALHGFADFNREMWEHIVNEHDGKLPVRIKAVREGTVVPTRNALVTIENTDPKCAPLTSYLETALLRGVWYPTTVATLSYNAKKIIKKYMEKTADSLEGLPFKFHDFGARGVSSKESAGLGGLAHLVNFMGTDTIESLLYAGRYYNVDLTEGVPAFSIPAAEHSTMTSWGKENETDAYRNMLKAYGREGSLLAVVSDSYDIYNACENIWGKELRQEVIDSGATVVIRPDSGHPPTVVLNCLEILAKQFGYSTTEKGYKLLNTVRVIQGDGIDLEMLEEILEVTTEAGFCADNLAFGCGGGLLQKVDRDTLKFALKCSSIVINDEYQDVWKKPVTDSGKDSKRGRLQLYRDKKTGEITTGREAHGADVVYDVLLETYYENGEILIDDNFEEIRARAV